LQSGTAVLVGVQCMYVLRPLLWMDASVGASLCCVLIVSSKAINERSPSRSCFRGGVVSDGVRRPRSRLLSVPPKHVQPSSHGGRTHASCPTTSTKTLTVNENCRFVVQRFRLCQRRRRESILRLSLVVFRE
jgi:hypothetical protein